MPITPIPYGRQDIDSADVEAVAAVLRSDWLTQGPMVPRFEAAIAAYCGSRYGVACTSGTAALHLACLALGLKAGDRLWTTPITFAASANCALYCGAQVNFVDIDPITLNICPAKLEAKLEQAAKDNALPRILVAVHFAGYSCDMEAIGKLAQHYGIKLIEDACHALGGRYQGAPIGNCRYSDIAVFSFHPVKPITTGEGGMAVCNEPELAERMALFRSHGIVRDPEHLHHPDTGAWYYEQHELGFNYRMTDLQAALGLSQMARLDPFTARRREKALYYQAALKDSSLTLPPDAAWVDSAGHLYVVQVPEPGWRRPLFDDLRQKGILVNVHYLPVYRHPYYARLGFTRGYCPDAEYYYERALTLPLYPGLTTEQQDYVVHHIQAGLAQASMCRTQHL